MAPFSPEHRNNESSESDEDGNARHDRFKSERFQDNSSNSRRVPRSEGNTYQNSRMTDRRHRARTPPQDNYQNNRLSDRRNRDRTPTEENYQSNRLNERRHRDRTPPRNYTYKETSSSSFSSRESRRSDHDRKDRERKHHSRVCKSDNIYEETRQESLKNKYNENKEDQEPVKSNKNKLSSLLKNFDKQVQSKLANVNSETVINIGPALPPNFKEKSTASKESDNDDSMLGPILPKHLKSIHETSDNEFGVALPPHLKQKQEQAELDSSEEETASSPHLLESDEAPNEKNDTKIQQAQIVDTSPFIEEKKPDVFGPVLPPKVEVDSYGPALPPTLLGKDTVQGPFLPPGITSEQLELMAQEESDEDTVGPLPEGKMTLSQYQLELRASQIKRKLEEEKNGPTAELKKREEWMLELPPEKATNLGLGPRSFRKREAPDMSNRSSWTDTPADKQRKEEMALRGEVEPVNNEEVSRAAFIRERDEVMDKMAKKSREEDRPQSLLELHQKKIKKKKKKEEKEGKKKERRPFDRNIDLQVNRFDDAQKKAIFKKAQLLDTRFSTGESKYL